jgi:predicted RNA-binding protein YlxR (DUF448 family)/ribosomal protein L30E
MIRTCVGCHTAEAPEALVRLVLGPDGSLVADPRGGSIGRGAWVHARPDCLSRAVPRGAAKALKANVRSTPSEVAAQLRAAGKRRALALLSQARHAKKTVAGSTAASEALDAGDARWVVVAADARASASLPAIATAISGGYGIVLGTKEEVGLALGRPETGVVAILDENLAESLRHAAALAHFPEPSSPSRDRAELVTEAS